MKNGSVDFLDTNILIYEWDSSEPIKRDKARELVSRLGSSAVISSQVAQEFTWSARRKLGLTTDEIDAILSNYSGLGFVSISLTHVRRANKISEVNKISFWDALIVQAALSAGCKRLYTEDLNHGQKIQGLKITNPFL